MKHCKTDSYTKWRSNKHYQKNHNRKQHKTNLFYSPINKKGSEIFKTGYEVNTLIFSTTKVIITDEHK